MERTKELWKQEGSLFTGLGEVLFDMLPEGPRLGGAPANFAWTVHALGGRALVVSAVGDDELGREAAALLAEKELPAELFTVPQGTGHVDVSLDAGGVPSYRFAADPAYEALPWTERTARAAARTAVCCFGTLARYGAVTRATAARFLQAMPAGSFRVYDVNLRGTFYTPELVEESLAMADAVKCNEDELPVLCRFAGIAEPSPKAYFRYLRLRGARCFIYTEGAVRSTVFLDGEKSVRPTPPVEVADTVGAGDAFTGAFMAALSRDLPLGEAHAFAAAAASFVCTRSGAMPDYPASFRQTLERAGL